MSGDFDPEERIEALRKNILEPLRKENRLTELSDRVEVVLEGELNPRVRFELISEMASALRLFDEVLSHDWIARLTAEFDEDPFAWCQFANWHFMPEQSTKDELQTVLNHYGTALERARAKNEFIRYVLFDICRILREAQDFAGLEERMREILQDLEIRREVDCPFVEADWLNGITDGAVDPDLAERFRRLEAADKERFKQLGYEIRPATLDELEN